MLKRLGDRAALILALSPAAIFILIAFIVILGPRLAANLNATSQATDSGSAPGTAPATAIVTAAATSAATPTVTLPATQPAIPQPATPTLTATPEGIIIHNGDFVRLS